MVTKERFLDLIQGLHTYFSDSSNLDKIELFIEKAKNENAWFSDYLISIVLDLLTIFSCFGISI